jgi:hypothetical protein
MVKPIHNMMKHDQSFSWMEDVKKDFVELKRKLVQLGLGETRL